MALPTLQNNDLVKITFKNHDEMSSQHGDIYTSAKVNPDSIVRLDDIMSLIAGGTARIEGFDKSSITIEFNEEENDFDVSGYEIRVERKFIKSIELLKRFKSISFGDEWHLHLPSDPKEDLELFDMNDEGHEDSFDSGSVKAFLKKIKKFYYPKKKKKAKKKASKKGLNITKENFKDGMKVDIKGIAWDDSDDDLNSTELLLVFKGSFTNVEMYFGNDKRVYVIDPSTQSYAGVRMSLIESITLNGEYKPDEDDGDYHNEYGELLDTEIISGHDMIFFEKGITIGCQDFDLKDIKTTYKALCKVYGEPK